MLGSLHRYSRTSRRPLSASSRMAFCIIFLSLPSQMGNVISETSTHSPICPVQACYSSSSRTGRAATESYFVAQAGNFNILHLTAHGQLNTVSPLFSRIVLAPDGATDGSLEVRDIYGLDLKNSDLVVLSACQTELGAQSEGDDIIGLNRAFI